MTVVAETIPEDVRETATQAFNAAMTAAPTGEVVSMIEVIARAILAAEARMGELLKDPVAVRLNWQRGGVNADSIIAEVRERCAEVADVAADEQDVLAMSAGERSFAIYRQGERVAKSIASSIRSGAKP